MKMRLFCLTSKAGSDMTIDRRSIVAQSIPPNESIFAADNQWMQLAFALTIDPTQLKKASDFSAKTFASWIRRGSTQFHLWALLAIFAKAEMNCHDP
jgi:hypothetical protein